MPSKKRSLYVFKFGGTSTSTPERLIHVSDLITSHLSDARIVVVVSALGGVTDQIEEAVGFARDRSEAYRPSITELLERHENVVADLLTGGREKLQNELAGIWRELEELLDGVFLLRECTPRTKDAIMGMGERASAPILAAVLQAQGQYARAFDGRALIRTDDSFGEANVDFEVTDSQVQEQLRSYVDSGIAVVSGFIGRADGGAATTLGRSGSDYSATILAQALRADRVVIWTDVNGVLSADPRLVPAAFTIRDLSYQEAAEMAYFGAKVLHPRTMRPLREDGISLIIKNTMNPDDPGTRISSSSEDTRDHVKAVSAVRELALIMLEGSGMMGIPGIAARTFRALADDNINVLIISQASSEQSICIGVRSTESQAAESALKKEFELELHRREVSRIYAVPECAVVSLVGDQMRMKPGLAGRMFSTLGRANINVLAIAQGAAETNISAVISDTDTERAVRALHESFARSYERLHLFLVGPGAVGSKLLDLLERHGPGLSEDRHLNLRLAGLANSSKVLFDADGIDFDQAISRLESEGRPMALPETVAMLRESHVERLIFVDATASDEVASLYEELLESGIAVVTPNKRANTREQAFYDRLHRLSEHRDVPFLYETTVGAALPVIDTLRNLVRSGDRIHRIQGVLSGTLAFVFNEMSDGKTFSEAVREAHERGFTEPDPREDLAGEDVARKLLTLAREAGRVLEREDIAVTSLLPEENVEEDVEPFLDRLSHVDDEWSARIRSGPVQYLATMDESGCRVSVESVSNDSPFRALKGTDNCIVFETERYADRPLVIQGAGAGPELTASGVLSDILRAAETML